MTVAVRNRTAPALSNPIKQMQKPIMQEIRICKRFKRLPTSERNWFFKHKHYYTSQVKKRKEEPTSYCEKKAIKLFLNEYNAQCIERAKRNYEVAMMQYNKQMELQSILGFHAVETKESFEYKANCSSSHTFYSFSRDITKEEFISFLKKMGKEIIPLSNWWRDYTKIEGKGCEWTYIYLKPCLNVFNEEP